MKYKALLILCAVGMYTVFGTILPNITLAAEDCQRSTYDGPEPHYSGKMIDSHFHIPAIRDTGSGQPRLGRDITLADMDCLFRYEGTSRAFAFFPVYQNVSYHRFLEAAQRAEQRYPNRFVRFLMPPGDDDIPPSIPASTVKEIMTGYEDIFQGYGEIGLYSLSNGRKASEYPPNAKIFRKIYEQIVRKHNLIVYLHPGDGHADNLDKVLSRYPDINFVVHGDQIQPYIDELMTEHANVYFTVNDLYGDQYLLRADGTKQDFLDGLADWDPLLEKDVNDWKAMIEAHPNQFMWGTDRGDALWTFDHDVGKILADYGRAFIGQLDEDVQEKFAYKNALRVINSR